MTTATERTRNRLNIASELVAAYVLRNRVPVSELPALIASIRATLERLSQGQAVQPAEPEPLVTTAAQIRKSITNDALISFIDGKRYKTLKRHLTAHGLNPDTYRTQYGLPADYPMVTAAYSELRETLAKGIGLGHRNKGHRKAR